MDNQSNLIEVLFKIKGLLKSFEEKNSKNCVACWAELYAINSHRTLANYLIGAKIDVELVAANMNLFLAQRCRSAAVSVELGTLRFTHPINSRCAQKANTWGDVPYDFDSLWQVIRATFIGSHPELAIDVEMQETRNQRQMALAMLEMPAHPYNRRVEIFFWKESPSGCRMAFVETVLKAVHFDSFGYLQIGIDLEGAYIGHTLQFSPATSWHIVLDTSCIPESPHEDKKKPKSTFTVAKIVFL